MGGLFTRGELGISTGGDQGGEEEVVACFFLIRRRQCQSRRQSRQLIYELLHSLEQSPCSEMFIQRRGTLPSTASQICEQNGCPPRSWQAGCGTRSASLSFLLFAIPMSTPAKIEAVAFPRKQRRLPLQASLTPPAQFLLFLARAPLGCFLSSGSSSAPSPLLM